MRRNPTRSAQPRLGRKIVVGTWTPEFSVFSHVRHNSVAISTGLPAANDPYAFPFRMSEPVTVRELMVYNGSSAGGNVDMGIYNTSWARLVSAGTTGGTGNSLWQIMNVTDTPLEENRTYYLVLVRDNATANRQRSFSGSLTVSQNALAGVQDSTTDAFPLPDPLTNMALAAAITQIPVMGFSCRVLF